MAQVQYTSVPNGKHSPPPLLLTRLLFCVNTTQSGHRSGDGKGGSRLMPHRFVSWSVVSSLSLSLSLSVSLPPRYSFSSEAPTGRCAVSVWNKLQAAQVTCTVVKCVSANCKTIENSKHHPVLRGDGVHVDKRNTKVYEERSATTYRAGSPSHYIIEVKWFLIYL